LKDNRSPLRTVRPESTQGCLASTFTVVFAVPSDDAATHDLKLNREFPTVRATA
jgi:hypothetical protein